MNTGLSLAAVLAAALSLSAAPASARPAADLVLQGRLFDARAGEVIEDGVVVVAGGRVVCSGAADACEWSGGPEVRAFADATILPGLIDLHVHARSHYAAAFPAMGVTTVRDANNTLAAIAAIRANPFAPRVLASGPMLDSPQSVIIRMSETAGRAGEHPIETIMPLIADDAAEAIAAVDALAAAGADHVKLYESLGEEAFRAAAARAREHGLPVMTDAGTAFTRGLTLARMDIVDAANAGVDTVEHFSGLALAYRQRGGDPFAETVDMTIMSDIARDLQAAGTAQVPTLATRHLFADSGALDLSGFGAAERLAPFMEGQWSFSRRFAQAQTARLQADGRLSAALLPQLLAAGVLIGAGSDTPAAPGALPGAALHMELEALVHAGLTPADALQAATVNAARIIRRADLGHLGAGAVADIVVVAGDPLADIRDSRNILAVWRAGEALDIDAAWAAAEAEFAELMRRYAAAQESENE